MAQNLRDTLSNRKFAIPLIALLGVCFIGLLLLGVVLILPGLRDDSGRVAQEATPEAEIETETAATSMPATPTTKPTDAPTPKPSPTLVPVGTAIESSAGSGTTAPGAEATESAGAPVVSEGEATSQAEATIEPTPEGGYGDQPTATVAVEDEELAETGIGLGLVLISGVGLGAVAVAARRLRMAI